ncbi:DUF4435 domain-containing protein [Chloroflexota bacterium]
MTEQGGWGYSTSALNVLHRFFRVRFVVFVEGADDIVFWSAQFQKAGLDDYHTYPVGGMPKLRKIISQIVNENARVIAACDSGYSILIGDLPSHSRVVGTFGHSIENTMYCPHTLNLVIGKLSRIVIDRTGIILKWFEEFSCSCRDLIIYDLAREENQKPVAVMGDKCSRFLRTTRSPKLDDGKISKHIDDIKDQFQENELVECTRLIGECERELRHIIKGHFLTNGVVNFVKNVVRKQTGKRPALPLDSLYALTSDGCVACANACSEFPVVEGRIKKAVESLDAQ